MTKTKKDRLIKEVKDILLGSPKKLGEVTELLGYKNASTIKHYIEKDVEKLLLPKNLKVIYEVLNVPKDTVILEEYYVDKDNHLRDN